MTRKMEASDKAVKLTKFDGKRESFPFWWKKFTAFARVYNFMEALKKDASLPVREDEVLATDAEGKLQAQAKQRNNIAMACLVSAFSNFFANDVVTEFNALITNKHGRTRNQLADLVLTLATERAVQQLAGIVFFARIIGH